MSITTNKRLITNYIQEIWNQGKLELLDNYIHPDYQDYSLIPSVPPNKQGLALWIKNTSKAFNHTTEIKTIIAEDDEVSLRIDFKIVHIGEWRNIKATGKEVTIKGFRNFKLYDGKIIEHWALIDGEMLQAQLTDQTHGCAIVNEH